MKKLKNIDLRRGDVVVAKRNVDPYGANVRKGTIGVVFEERNAYGDGKMDEYGRMQCLF